MTKPSIISPVRPFTFAFRVIACLLLAGALIGFARPAAAKSAVYNQFNVAVDLQTNGDLNVVETQVVSFSGGSFTNGQRTIPLARTTGIDQVTVSEKTASGLVPFAPVPARDVTSAADQFNATPSDGNLNVNWHFSSSGTSQRTFVVSYVVHGALRDYPTATPANQQVWWTAIGSDLTSQTPVQAATVTIHLPKAVDLNSTQVDVNDAGVQKAAGYSSDGQTFTFTHGSFSPGGSMIARVIFPSIITGVQPPPWQAQDDASRAAAQTHKQHQAELAVFSVGAALVILVMGGLLLYFLWYTKGRDPHTGLAAEFLATPPDALAPGIAGTLLDERADEQDVVATFLDLARRGVITMADAGLSEDHKQATGLDFNLTIAQDNPALAPYEETIMGAVFGKERKAGSQARLGEAGMRLRSVFPQIETQLYQGLVDQGLFNQSPEATRERWSKVSGWLVTIFVFAGTIVGFTLSWFVTIPCMAAALVALVMKRLGRSMPQKTAKGAEETAKWLAFKRYLKDLDKYEHVQEKSAIFERYLAYAVAFGLDSTWIYKFRTVGVQTPAWFDGGTPGLPGLPGIPGGRGFSAWEIGPMFGPGPGLGGGHGGGGGLNMPDVKMPGMPNVQSMSNKAGGGVQAGSTGLASLLNIAGVILEVVSSISGGGSGGSSGGGGGGFS